MEDEAEVKEEEVAVTVPEAESGVVPTYFITSAPVFQRQKSEPTQLSSRSGGEVGEGLDWVRKKDARAKGGGRGGQGAAG